MTDPTPRSLEPLEPTGPAGPIGPIGRSDPVLFVSGDASRTGSPRILASLVDWIAGHTDHPVQLLLERGGPLLDQLERSAEVRVVDRKGEADRRSRPESLALGLDELGRHRSARRLRQARSRYRLRKLAPPGLVWANGAGALRWLDAVPAEVPVVAHIHELAVGIDRSLAGLDVTTALARPDRFVAVSEAVADHLVRDRGVDPAKVLVHHGWVPEPAAEPPGVVGPSPRIGLPEDALLVGGCGTMGWRKGTSLFLALAQAVGPEVGGRPVHWAWIGGGRALDLDQAARELALRGLHDRVRLLPEVADPQPWFDAFDAFALTSREDPFPLVALEAGAAGIPVLSFASGGVVELLRGDTEECVSDPLDLVGFADRLRAVLADPHRRAALGADLRARVDVAHRPAAAIPRLWAAVTGETTTPT